MSEIDNSYFASGHSYQSNEPGITIGMNGVIEKETNKNLAKENNLIYLSKPLGIGYLLAAYYQNSELLNSEDFNKILTFLKYDNQNAIKAGRAYNVKVMTDISGFGLASHLGDICNNSKLTARVDLTNEILINSNIEILKNYKSTGFDSNFKSVSKYVDVNINNPYQNILYDPQTNGPMLLIVDQNYKKDFERTYREFNNTCPILIGKFEAKGEYLIKINQ